MLTFKQRGFKAIDREVQLSGRTLLIGPNGSGKSSTLDALRYLAIGYVPFYGKSESVTAEMMRGSEIEVSLSDGQRVMRRSLLDRGDSLKGTAEASWITGKRNRDHHAAILSMFGVDPLDIAECFDIRSMLDETPAKRTARIEALLGLAGIDPEDIARAVARRTVLRLIEREDKPSPQPIDELMEMVRDAQRPILIDVAETLDARIRAGGGPAGLAWAGEEKRASGITVKNRRAARKELADRCASIPDSSPADLINLKVQRDTLQKSLGAAEEREAVSARISSDRESVTGEISKLETVLGNAKSKRDTLPSTSAADGIRKRIVELQQVIATFEPLPPRDEKALRDHDGSREVLAGDLQKVEQEIDDLSTKRQAIHDGMPDIIDTVAIQQEIENLALKIRDLDADPWRKVQTAARSIVSQIHSWGEQALDLGVDLDDIERLAAAIQTEALERVGVDPEVFKATIKDKEAEQAKLKVAADAVQKVRSLSHDEMVKVGQEIGRKRGERTETLNRCRMHDRARADIKKVIDEDHKSATLAIVENQNEIRAELSTFQADILKHDKEAAEVNEKVTSMDALLTSAKSRLAGLIRGSEAPEDDAPSAEALESEIETVAADIDKMEKAAAAISELNEIIDDIKTAEAGHDVFTAIEWSLQRQRENDLDQVSDTLIGRINIFLGNCDRPERAYSRFEKGVCQIGWRADIDGLLYEVPVAALSGGEWVLFVAGLTLAVIELRSPPIKMLLVDADKCVETLPQLLKGLNLTASKDTIIVAASAIAKETEGWDTEDYTPESVEAEAQA